jgi:hypothetical protein
LKPLDLDCLDTDDLADDSDFVQPNIQEQCESESDFSDTEFIANKTLNTRNRPSTSHRSRSRSPLSDRTSQPNYYLGKDNITKWNIDGSPLNVRTRSHNIILHLPGVKRYAKDAKSIVDCWNLFFTDTVIEEIVNCTNIYLVKIRINYRRENILLFLIIIRNKSNI